MTTLLETIRPLIATYDELTEQLFGNDLQEPRMEDSSISDAVDHVFWVICFYIRRESKKLRGSFVSEGLNTVVEEFGAVWDTSDLLSDIAAIFEEGSQETIGQARQRLFGFKNQDEILPAFNRTVLKARQLLFQHGDQYALLSTVEW